MIADTSVVNQADAAVAASLLSQSVLPILHYTSILSAASSTQDSNGIVSSAQDSTGLSSLSSYMPNLFL